MKKIKFKLSNIQTFKHSIILVLLGGMLAGCTNNEQTNTK